MLHTVGRGFAFAVGALLGLTAVTTVAVALLALVLYLVNG